MQKARLKCEELLKTFDEIPSKNDILGVNELN